METIGNPSLSPAIRSLSMLETMGRDMASRMVWTVDEKEKTIEDFTPYLKEKLVVSLEMELDWYYGGGGGETWEKAIGLKNDMPYACPVCETDACGIHDPPSLIRMAKNDSTINGKELIVWGMPISSMEFARRLPLAGIRRHFHVKRHDSMHTHTLISEYTNPNPKKIPVVIARNAWNLFRAYYPAWVYIFGNYPRQFHRSEWGAWKRYNVTADNYEDWRYESQNKFNGGLHFNQTHIVDGMIDRFDAEIRTQDGSTWLDQIVAARSMSKALFLRASDLANSGLIGITGERLEEVNDITYTLNKIVGYEPVDVETQFGQTMKMRAYELVGQLAPYLDRFETACIKNCIDHPVRHRRHK